MKVAEYLNIHANQISDWRSLEPNIKRFIKLIKEKRESYIGITAILDSR